MILKMAMKHLLANKAKTIIIISLIGIGSFLVVAGLGVLNYATQQTKNVCINDFSGDVLITGKPEDKSIRVTLLGAGKTVNTGDLPEMPYVPQFEKIIQKVQELPQTAAFTQSITAGYGLLKPIDLPDSWKAKPENSSFNDVPYSSILGIQPSSYKKMFDTIHVHDGIFPDSDDEEFFLLDDDTKRRYEKYYEREIHVGDEIIVAGLYGRKMRLKKLKVSGFFTFAHPDTAIQGILYSDVNSARIIGGVTMGAQTVAEIPKSIDLSLSDKSEDELFSDDSLSVIEEIASTPVSHTDIHNLLGSTELRDRLNMADTKAWHHIAIKLHDSAQTAQVIKTLNAWFEKENINAQALPWDEAMASFALLIKITRTLMISVLVVLSVVVLIVIMNTLVVSVMERTAEIGTMRALGANRTFVKKVFYAESFLLSCTGACIGIALALLAAFIFNSLGIRFKGEVLAAMFGGYNVKSIPSLKAVFGTLCAMLASGVAANWYPIKIALKISPLQAINS